MPENFFIDNKRDIEAYTKWLDETLTDESGKTDPLRDLIYVDKGHYIKSKLIVNFLNKSLVANFGKFIPKAIDNLGNNFTSIIKSDREKDKDKIEVDVDTVMNFLGQAAQEIHLHNEGVPDYSFSEILNYFFYSEYRTDEEKAISVYLTGKLPLIVCASIVNEDKDSISNKLKNAETKADEWNSKFDNLNDTVTKVTTLEENLKELKVSFNFLGLSAAFKQFYTSKRISLFITLTSLCVLGIFLIAIPSYTYITMNNKLSENIYTESKSETENNKDKTKEIEKDKANIIKPSTYSSAILAMPLIAIELIFLYFFRIFLQHYNSTKSQIMQLQMRNALCQFIETYVKFKDENKEHKDSFEKFESQVFSGLAPNDETIPSTFDGIEQLGKLVKTLKG